MCLVARGLLKKREHCFPCACCWFAYLLIRAKQICVSKVPGWDNGILSLHFQRRTKLHRDITNGKERTTAMSNSVLSLCWIIHRRLSYVLQSIVYLHEANSVCTMISYRNSLIVLREAKLANLKGKEEIQVCIRMYYICDRLKYKCLLHIWKIKPIIAFHKNKWKV